MIEIVNMIPENVGWAAVGATGMLALVLAVKLVKVVVDMVKDHITADFED